MFSSLKKKNFFFVKSIYFTNFLMKFLKTTYYKLYYVISFLHYTFQKRLIFPNIFCVALLTIKFEITMKYDVLLLLRKTESEKKNFLQKKNYSAQVQKTTTACVHKNYILLLDTFFLSPPMSTTYVKRLMFFRIIPTPRPKSPPFTPAQPLF